MNRVFIQTRVIALHFRQPHHPIPLAHHLESIVGLSPNRRGLQSKLDHTPSYPPAYHPIPLTGHLESIAGLSPNRRRIRAERAAGYAYIRWLILLRAKADYQDGE
ncbi:MAG: hypothetical protein O8C65_14900 [Candidatus Methanoperedens sp.]|nr:hypothetical protein [Candidatus Methanoperedens sp.]